MSENVMASLGHATELSSGIDQRPIKNGQTGTTGEVSNAGPSGLSRPWNDKWIFVIANQLSTNRKSPRHALANVRTHQIATRTRTGIVSWPALDEK
jgi:hypothetical protein